MLRFFRVARTFFMLHSFHIALFSFCSFSVLFRVAIFIKIFQQGFSDYGHKGNKEMSTIKLIQRLITLLIQHALFE